MKYPLSAASISVTFHPFGWGLHYVHRKTLTEFARAQGDAIWWLRVGCFTIAYGRML